MASKGVDISFLRGEAPEDLLRAFNRMEPKDQKAIARKAMRGAAKFMLPKIKSLVPVDTGRLRDTLKIKAIKRSRSGVGVTIMTGERAKLGLKEWDKQDSEAKWYYPAHVELGTSKMPAQSFLRAGFDVKKDGALKAAAEDAGKEYEKRWRKR